MRIELPIWPQISRVSPPFHRRKGRDAHFENFVFVFEWKRWTYSRNHVTVCVNILSPHRFGTDQKKNQVRQKFTRVNEV